MKKYALIGASGRAALAFAKPIKEQYSHCAEVCGLFDVNELRAKAVADFTGVDCPIYTNCDRMLAEVKPDVAIITTVDRYHHIYAAKCLEAGVDVIIEKPMTIDAEKVRAILDAEKRTGRKVTVTFNYRFGPYVSAVKEALAQGAVGEVLSADFEYMLDLHHGADFFRRWHRKKENSGGLLVHKATHHFDLLNWWIEQEPIHVMAFGEKRIYGSAGTQHGERCLTCDHKDSCKFFWDATEDDLIIKMFINCESADGYHRDQCVFADEIDIEDTMSATVRYSGGALLSYSLIAHGPYEGWKASINGTKGRLEAAEYTNGPLAGGTMHTFDIFNHRGEKITHTIPRLSGSHGGGDERLLKMLLEENVPDPLKHCAGSYAGAVSCLVGIAANESIATGRDVRINDLVPLEEYAILRDIR